MGGIFLFSWENRSYFVFGAGWIIVGVLSLFFPRLIASKKLERELEDKGNAIKKYRIHARMNALCLGFVFVGAIFFPLSVKNWFVIAGFVLVLASILWCNKRYLGRFRASKW